MFFCGIKAPDRKLAGLKVKDLEFRKDGACSCRKFPNMRGTLFWGPYNKDPTI